MEVVEELCIYLTWLMLYANIRLVIFVDLINSYYVSSQLSVCNTIYSKIGHNLSHH